MRRLRFAGVVLATALVGCSKNSNLQSEWTFPSYQGDELKVHFAVTADNSELRQYKQTTSQPVRDDAPLTKNYAEHQNHPRLRSGDIAFDALFALAIDELKGNAVESIRDGAYADGQSIPCECFETGAKWHYVWTRDLSYAADLGLSWVDPQRVVQSLKFKTSELRDGVAVLDNLPATGRQIVQDTGSGGSWPISTDRLSWGVGAASVLDNVSASERVEFASFVLDTLTNTIENDRLAAFDTQTGLYNGEQSFLDWREQTYAEWVKDELTYMATSSALSTNVLQYMALQQAAALAKTAGINGAAARYTAWASDLKTAINTQLWLPRHGLYSSLTSGHFDKAPLEKFDWLGQSLAIISGVADTAKATSILASYPHGPFGAPVIFPQQPNIPVYHNRALWPFVTAYGLQAAVSGDNPLVANRAYESLIRGAALNLSNMENLEWLSGQPLWVDAEAPDLQGPVINSERQLWSVGAYIGMVVEGVFGLHPQGDVLTINPYITPYIQQRYLASGQQATLFDLTWQGKKLNLTLNLPEVQSKDQRAVYRLAEVRLNGSIVSRDINVAQLGAQNEVVITLSQHELLDVAINEVTGQPSPYDEQLFAPATPQLSLSVGSPQHTLTIVDDLNSRGAVTYRLYRNGVTAVVLDQPDQWRDEFVPEQVCYSVDAVFNSSGLVSHRSKPVCTDQGEYHSVADLHVATNTVVEIDNQGPVLKRWGQPTDQFALNNLELGEGNWDIQVRYRNTLHSINTGITNGVKWLVVKNAVGRDVSRGVVQMPHMQGPQAHLSTPVRVTLPRDGRYSVELHDFFNMSYFSSNATYGAAGGEQGALNIVDLYGINIRPAN